jgi:hypothetical protein
MTSGVRRPGLRNPSKPKSHYVMADPDCSTQDQADVRLDARRGRLLVAGLNRSSEPPGWPTPRVVHISLHGRRASTLTFEPQGLASPAELQSRSYPRLALMNCGFGADSLSMTRPLPDPARGAEAARKLKSLGVKGVLVKAAELRYIMQVTCRMPECFRPEELGGARYFEPLTDKHTDWMPTKRGRSLDNTVLAHRLCNRTDYSISVGRPYARDLERVRKAREAAAGS